MKPEHIQILREMLEQKLIFRHSCTLDKLTEEHEEYADFTTYLNKEIEALRAAIEFADDR